jgi:hypothetical protein
VSLVCTDSCDLSSHVNHPVCMYVPGQVFSEVFERLASSGASTLLV